MKKQEYNTRTKDQLLECLIEDPTLTINELCELGNVPYSLVDYWINKPVNTVERQRVRSNAIRECLIKYPSLTATELDIFMHISKGGVMQELRELYIQRILPSVNANVYSERYGEGVILNVDEIKHRGRLDHKVTVKFTDTTLKRPKSFIFGMGLLLLETSKGKKYDALQQQLLLRVERSSDDIDWENPLKKTRRRRLEEIGATRARKKPSLKDSIQNKINSRANTSMQTLKKDVRKAHPAKYLLLEYFKENPNVSIEHLASRFNISTTTVKNWTSVEGLEVYSEFYYRRQEDYKAILDYVTKHPDKSLSQIDLELGISQGSTRSVVLLSPSKEPIIQNPELSEISQLRQTIEQLNNKVNELTVDVPKTKKRKSPIKAVASIRLRIPFYVKKK